jgi:hypothetical protein
LERPDGVRRFFSQEVLSLMRGVTRRVLVLPTIVLVAMGILFAHGAAAQSATGTITGRVLWGPCIRAIPLPAAPASPDAQAQPAPQPATAGLPAGAALVAVQSTGVSARTDEVGNFTLSGVPAGQYLTIAAGPVANAASAVAERPNVFVNGGQTMDIGTLSLGGGSPAPLGIPCRVLPPVVGAPGAADSGQAVPAPEPADTPNP